MKTKRKQVRKGERYYIVYYVDKFILPDDLVEYTECPLSQYYPPDVYPKYQFYCKKYFNKNRGGSGDSKDDVVGYKSISEVISKFNELEKYVDDIKIEIWKDDVYVVTKVKK